MSGSRRHAPPAPALDPPQRSPARTPDARVPAPESRATSEWVKGKSVDEILAIKNSDIAAHLKLPPVKLHCSMLAEDARGWQFGRCAHACFVYYKMYYMDSHIVPQRMTTS